MPAPPAWYENPAVRMAMTVIAASVSAVAAVMYLAPRFLGDWETIYEYSPLLLGFVGLSGVLRVHAYVSKQSTRGASRRARRRIERARRSRRLSFVTTTYYIQ